MYLMGNYDSANILAKNKNLNSANINSRQDYKDDNIVKCKFSEITVIMLKSWFLDKLAKHKFTSRKYKEMKSLMNMLYDFAIESNLTNTNVSRMIHGISYKKFAVEHEKAPTEQVYVNDEEENISKRQNARLN